jgi:hypothetical protein
MGILYTLEKRETRILDDEHIEQEINHLTKVFRNIGYRDRDIKKEVRKEEKVSISRNNQSSNMKAYLPYIRGVTDKIQKS